MTWTRVCTCLLVAALAAPAAADARDIRIKLPAPGHISINVVKVTVKGKQRGLPKRLKLRPQKLRALPSSVRVLYAQRTIRRKRATVYELVTLTVNVAKPAATAAQDDDGKPKRLGDIATIFLFFGSPNAAFEYQKQIEEEDEADRKAFAEMMSAAAADLAKQRDAELIQEALRSVVDPNGDGKVDAGLDTGHYDDGHAFGWGIKSHADERRTLGELLNDRLDQYIQQLEDSFQYDVDGDGTIEKPSGSGQQIDTQVGEPVITGGGS